MPGRRTRERGSCASSSPVLIVLTGQRGVAVDTLEYAPVPATLIAATRNRYSVPDRNRVTVNVRDSGARVVAVVQVRPFVEYSTR